MRSGDHPVPSTSGWDGDQQVTGFISRRVMDDWVDPRQPYRGRAVQRARQAHPRSDRANRHMQISARPGVQSPVPVCGYSAVRHHGKRRGARYERIGARTAASLLPTCVTLGLSFEGEPRGKALRCVRRVLRLPRRSGLFHRRIGGEATGIATPAPNWAIDIFPPNMQRARSRWERMGFAIGEREITQN
jgi:hypothetical protein